MSNEAGLLDSAANYIATYKKFVVLAHTNPDADAFGSSCGLALGLKLFGGQVQIVNDKGALPRYAHIPGVSQVISEPPALDEETLLCVCDCGASDRVGDRLIPWLRSAPNVLNIDHHFKNEMFGKVNLVFETASSASEIVAKLLLTLERKTSKNLINQENAYSLFAGMVADTGSFRYESTAPSTFEMAQLLMQRGASPHTIAQELFSNVSLPAVKLQSEALSNIALQCEGRFAEVTVTYDMIKKNGAEIEDSDSLVEKARDIKGVLVSALYKQDSELWRVSLRSRSPQYDISEIARSFGGGGHKVAAAFRSRKNLAEIQEGVRVQVRKLLS